jgi:hypothetical protein
MDVDRQRIAAVQALEVLGYMLASCSLLRPNPLAIPAPKHVVPRRAKSLGQGNSQIAPNRLTADVKAAMMAALGEVGGADYLKTVAQTDTCTFCKLLGKSTLVTEDAEAGPVRIEFS